MIQIDIPMPDCCELCPMHGVIRGFNAFCNALEKRLDTDGFEDWGRGRRPDCPIVELERGKPNDSD